MQEVSGVCMCAGEFFEGSVISQEVCNDVSECINARNLGL